jgi:hypothetical protein
MTMTATFTPTIAIVGYQVRSADRSTVFGEIEGVRSQGVRIHKSPGQPGRYGYLPGAAIAEIDETMNTAVLKSGITAGHILEAPPPPDERSDQWHKSSEWWANLLGHYGLFESEGRGNEPYLHPDQQ